jgi:hypothetical protein
MQMMARKPQDRGCGQSGPAKRHDDADRYGQRLDLGRDRERDAALMAAPVNLMTRSFGFKTTGSVGTGSGMLRVLGTGPVDQDACGALIALQASDHAVLFFSGNGLDALPGVAAGQPLRDRNGAEHVVG